jgi:hypothetical protein
LGQEAVEKRREEGDAASELKNELRCDHLKRRARIEEVIVDEGRDLWWQ